MYINICILSSFLSFHSSPPGAPDEEFTPKRLSRQLWQEIYASVSLNLFILQHYTCTQDSEIIMSWTFGKIIISRTFGRIVM